MSPAADVPRPDAPRPGGPDTPARQRDAAGQAIVRGVRDGVGVGVEVEIVRPETLERSLGKIRQVFDEREQ